MRRTLSVRLSVCPSVRPSRYRSLPSVTSRHLANYNDTHVRATYRTAISAAQILVNTCNATYVLSTDDGSPRFRRQRVKVEVRTSAIVKNS